MKPPPIKVGDYVKVIKTNISNWGGNIIGKICRVKSVSDWSVKGNDIQVEEDPNWLLRWTDGEWEPVNFSIYLEQIERL